MVEISTSAVAEEKSRLVLITLSSLTMRLMANWRDSTGEILGRVPDYDTIMIVGAIIQIGAEKLIRTNVESDLQNLANPFPEERLTACNITSVAVATGLKRETVRRKVNDLVRDGFLVRGDQRGLRLASDMLQLPINVRTIRSQLEAVSRAVRQLSGLDVFPG